ncbi:MAG: sigma-70 family RNA polymerase sigma factor [Planctomycetota bacterium]
MTPPIAAPSPPATAAERAVLDRLLVAGRTAHPTLEFAADRFEAAVVVRAAWTAAEDEIGRDDALREIERRGRAADLYLALACDAEVPGAWERLCATALPLVVRGLAARGLGPEAAAAEAADLPGHLIQRPANDRSATRLGGYRGTSSLATFLTTAAYARFASERRRVCLASLDRETPSGARAIDPPAPASSEPRPEQAEQARRLHEALPVAWSRLTDREAVALLYKGRDGLPQTTIARLLGVGPPRVSRILDAAYERLRDSLGSVLGVAPGEAPDLDAAEFAAEVGRFLATLLPSPRPGGGGIPPSPAAPFHPR